MNYVLAEVGRNIKNVVEDRVIQVVYTDEKKEVNCPHNDENNSGHSCSGCRH